MNKKQLILLVIPGIATSFIINLFLSGKIIDYPRGTHEGGMIAAAGVLLIIAVTFGVTFLLFKFGMNREDQKLNQ